MATRRPLDGLRVFELLNDKISLARADIAAQPGASHLPDMLRDYAAGSTDTTLKVWDSPS